MRRLVIIVGMIAGMLSLGVRPGQTETTPDKPGAAPVPPLCTLGQRHRVTSRIINVWFQDSDVIVTIAAGSNAGVARDWTAHMLRGDSDKPLSGGEIQILRVDKAVTKGKIHITSDELMENPRVELVSP